MEYSVQITNSFPTDVATLFQFCSHRTLLKNWFFPGGWSADTNYQLTREIEHPPENTYRDSRDPTDNLGTLKGDDSYVFTLEVKEVRPGATITFNFSSALVKDSIIQLSVSPDEAGALLTISQSNLPDIESATIFQEAWIINLGILREKIVGERLD